MDLGQGEKILSIFFQVFEESFQDFVQFFQDFSNFFKCPPPPQKILDPSLVENTSTCCKNIAPWGYEVQTLILGKLASACTTALSYISASPSVCVKFSYFPKHLILNTRFSYFFSTPRFSLL